MTSRLEDFVRALGRELFWAQESTRRAWPGTRVESMEMLLFATVEYVGDSGGLGLRVDATANERGDKHELRIEVPGAEQDAIVARLNGKVLGRYRSVIHGEAY